MARKTFLLWSLSFCFCFLPSLSSAATVSFDFSSGIGPDFSFFDVGESGFSLDDTGGNLQINNQNAPALVAPNIQGGYISSNFKFGGDFDIKVDYVMNSDWLQGTQIQINTDGMAMVRSWEGYQNYHVWDGVSWKGAVPTTDNSGVLEIKRIGSQITSYYNANLLYSAPTNLDDMSFSVCVQGNGYWNFPGGPVAASFDNFSITADRFVGLQASPDPVPEPATMFLMGTGIAGLVAARRRKKA
jgi:hypothetical protein